MELVCILPTTVVSSEFNREYNRGCCDILQPSIVLTARCKPCHPPAGVITDNPTQQLLDSLPQETISVSTVGKLSVLACAVVVISSQVIASTSGCLDLRCLLQVPLPSSGSRVHSGSSMSSVIPRSLAAVNTLSSWHIFLKPISAHDLVEAYFMDLKDLYYGSRLAN